MYPPAPSDLSGENVPRPPWRAHAVVLAVILAALFGVVVGMTSDSLNQIFLFLFVFAPLAVTYASVSTLLVWSGARSRPVRSARRILWQAHALALFLGLAAGLLVPNFF